MSGARQNRSETQSLLSQTGGATKPGQVNAQNFTPAPNDLPSTLTPIANPTPANPTPANPSSSPTWNYQDAVGAGKFGSLKTGYFDNYQDAVNAANGVNPRLNPASVNLNIDETIPGDALNALPSALDQEQEQILKDLRTGVADLSAEQSQEYYDLKQNPEGVFGPGVHEGMLGRLSEQQSIELNARVGQLNALIDNYELQTGLRPQVLGTPQIDDATGNAFVYMQDPTTGEITVQELGQVTSPDSGGGDGFTLGKDQIRYDAAGNPIAYGIAGDSAGGESGGFKEGVATTGRQAVSNMLKIAISNPEIFGRTAAAPIPDMFRSHAFLNYKAQLDFLKGNVIPAALTAMREASKTGGALGQVSDREGAWLAASLGALEMYQSPDAVQNQLRQIDTHLASWQSVAEEHGFDSGIEVEGEFDLSEFGY